MFLAFMHCTKPLHFFWAFHSEVLGDVTPDYVTIMIFFRQNCEFLKPGLRYREIHVNRERWWKCKRYALVENFCVSLLLFFFGSVISRYIDFNEIINTHNSCVISSPCWKFPSETNKIRMYFIYIRQSNAIWVWISKTINICGYAAVLNIHKNISLSMKTKSKKKKKIRTKYNNINSIAYKFVLLFIFSGLIKHLFIVYFVFMIMVSRFQGKKKTYDCGIYVVISCGAICVHCIHIIDFSLTYYEYYTYIYMWVCVCR